MDESSTQAALVSADTLYDVVVRLKKSGYTAEFFSSNEKLRDIDTGKSYSPGQLTIMNVFRFEGLTDVDDMAILFAIETDDGTRGWISDAYGAYSDSALADILANVNTVAEMKFIEENSSVDADFDVVMEEPDDDCSQSKVYKSEISGDEVLKHLLSSRQELQSTLWSHKLVKHIPDNYCSVSEQNIFELYHMDELSEREISEIRNLSLEDQVKMIIHCGTSTIVHDINENNSYAIPHH